jgi:endonuclease/exonuclease/phosphatase family metal-dependent hydrolase
VKRNVFETLGSETIPLLPRGQNQSPRVAQLIWVRHRESQKNFAVANTHLSFPFSDSCLKKQEFQMNKLIQGMDEFVLKNDNFGCAQFVMGDLNVENRSSVCDQLRKAGYHNSFEISPPVLKLPRAKMSPEYEPRNMYASINRAPRKSGFVTHLTHHMEELGCDHIFICPELRNDAEKCNHTFVGNSHVLPRALPFDTWNHEFTQSDHRPIRANFIFSSIATDGVRISTRWYSIFPSCIILKYFHSPIRLIKRRIC